MNLEEGREQLSVMDTRARLEVVAELGYGLLESGHTTSQTERRLADCSRTLGIDDLSFTPLGRMIMLQAPLADGHSISVSGAARSLDATDCTRSRALNHTADELAAISLIPERSAQRQRLHALTSVIGLVLTRIAMPRLFAVAIQSAVAGAFATALVLMGFVDPVGAAAAIAVNWLLLLPLPQVIGAVTDAIEADFLSAVTRLAGVATAAVGIVIGGALTFGLGEALGMAHPRLEELPTFPWYLILVFSALGAIGNAFANGGRAPLVLPAAALGLVTGATNQLLLHGAGLSLLWASSLSAVVLGIITVLMAKRTGDPQPVLALFGITGALLPGIPVFFGIVQEMGFGSGGTYFLQAALICVGIGTGVAFGSYIGTLRERLRSRG